MGKHTKSLMKQSGTYAVAMTLLQLLCLFMPAMAVQDKTSSTNNKSEQQAKKAAELFDTIMAKPDEAIPQALLDKVEAVAVFTDVKRVGFLIEGLSYGHGVVSQRLAKGGWSAPAYYILRGYSIGPQLKAKSINIVMLFMNERSTKLLLEKKGVVFDRVKAPVAGPVGQIKTEQKEVVPVADVFSYTFDDNRLSGQDLKNMLKNFAITPDNDMNKATYRLKADELLMNADALNINQIPPGVSIFPQTLSRYSASQLAR